MLNAYSVYTRVGCYLVTLYPNGNSYTRVTLGNIRQTLGKH